MTERKFTRGLGKPGMAAQLRETVSQVVRESTVQNKLFMVEPVNFEEYISKNKTLLHNDPHRELLVYPPDDVSQVVLPRKYRTVSQPSPPECDSRENLLTKECLKSYASNWHLVHYKYSAYSGTYLELPKVPKVDELKDEVYEVDTDADQVDEGVVNKTCEGITKQGYLLKGPQVGSDRIFGNIASKSFKRRYCYLRREVDGTYILELHKDDKKGEAKATIVMDFCTEVVRSPKRGRFCMELRMPQGHKSHCLAAESEAELHDWLSKLQQVLHINRQQEDKPPGSLERASSTPPSPQQLPIYGTLKGLDQSMNPQLMKYSRETDMSIAHARKENRRRLFSVYPHMPHVKQGALSSVESNIEPFKEKFGLRILAKCEELKFKLQAPVEGESETLGQVEPYFTSMALYDARAGRKLSENFQFDINDELIRQILPIAPTGAESCNGNGHPVTDPLTHLSPELEQVSLEWLHFPKQAIFNISCPHSDIYLVMRIDKVLQGGMCPTSEPYVKNTKDPKLGLKVQRHVKTCSQRLGKYRMPFAWSAKPLFRQYSNELDTASEFPAIYRQDGHRLKDEDLIKILSDFRKPDKMSRLTVIPGSIKIQLELLTELPGNCLATNLMALKPFPIPPINDCTREVCELEGSVPECDVSPYTTFVSHLYVYPQSLNFDNQKTFARARNIACFVELRDGDEEDAKPLCAIYGSPGGPSLVSQICCSIVHHNTTPTWCDEVKIRLPIQITAKHHLLFTFYHISCDTTKKKDVNVETCVGYAWVPLLHKGRICVEEQILPVAAGLPPGYLAIQPLGLGKGVSNDAEPAHEGKGTHFSGPDVTWVDGQKPIFIVHFQMVSTVLTKDPHLHNLFVHAERLLDPKLARACPSETETCQILKAAHAVQLSAVLSLLPTILNQLLTLLVNCSSEDVGLNIIRLLVNIVNMVHDAGRQELLKIYVKYTLVAPTSSNGGSTVHGQLSHHLPTLLRPDYTDFLTVNKLMRHSDFFFQVMAKSMAQYLLSSGRIKMVRNERFSESYQRKIEELLKALYPYLQRYKEVPVETKQLNMSLAHFLKKCLTLMDRGYVFQLIKSYIELFNAEDSRTLFDYKLTFLQIICSHEHYVTLNLPLQRTSKSRANDMLSEFILCEDFCRFHFLVGLLLQEVRTALNQVVHTRRIAISVLRDLLAKHELDDRYQSKGQLSRIAALYAPWLGIVLENLNRLNAVHILTEPGFVGRTNRLSNSTGSCLYSVSDSLNSETSSRSSQHRITLHLDTRASLRSSTYLRDANYFAAIAGQGLVNGCSTTSLESESSTMSCDAVSTASQETTIMRDDCSRDGETLKTHSRSVSTSQPLRIDKITPGEVKDLLICFLFVVKYMSEEQLIAWWQFCEPSELLNFFRVLEMCLHHFKYTGRKNITSSNTSREMVPANKTGSAKAMTLPARMAPPDFSSDPCVSENSTTISGNSSGTVTTTIIVTSGTNSVGRESLVPKSNADIDAGTRLYQALLEANMATEVGLIALDALGQYCIHMRDSLLANRGDNPIMNKIFDILLSFLQVGQSETLFRHVFAALRALINNFSSVLFQGNASLCGRFCYELLRCCNSRLSTIRQEACAILYLLMRSNFEFTNGKGITRVHLQMIISVSQMLGNIVGLNNARFQESLSLINSYATSDKVMKGKGFPSEVKDLTKRVRTVLMATAQMREHHHDPEMLAALQHSLANSYASTPELRHTWLQSISRNHNRDSNFSEAAMCQLHIAALMAEYLKLKNVQSWGAEAFLKISSNIARDEIGLKLDAGVQDVQYTEQSLLEQLEVCAECLERAERYECLSEVYRLIVPMHEKKRNFAALAQCYQNLSKAYLKVTEVMRSGKRLLGRFFRVTFYGQAYFEEESGIDYIYKEPKVASLAEVSERLQRLYTSKFGDGIVKMMTDSAPVDMAELDPKLAHIQVTHVTPYFDKTDLEERQTEFEQNHDICRFMFETPFTKDGKKARGQPQDQWKRRTILTTEKSFPYVTKRIRVIENVIEELSPIEVALDEMQARVLELEEVALSKPTDAKKLQLRLQGSVCVQVNAGPLAYAHAFLEPGQSELYPDDKVEDLRDVFREFVKICYAALQVNSKIITSEQQEYQEVLRQNYHKLCQELSQLFGEPVWPDEELGSFKRNSQALFSAISGASANSSSA
ncbi:Dedicator of cytokinesis protein 9 [Frankliniella fusca]|uniref:Dedicator of cytokinesis protein 9 n=1 Tax=Frankliniella fusca TaxID=407009 RepID=A0AAE1H3D3_9NEOP|nr:Dedicator of cytokinesis protein 9 [Frankliniella fusca]